MTAVAVTLAIAVASALALIAWLVYRAVGASDSEADARVAQVATEAELERARYETEVTSKALAAANARANALERVIADDLNTAPNPDLARDDVRGRVLRLAQAWRTDDPLPASGDAAVPDDPAPGPSGALLRPGDEL